ncbi:MAG TPA: helix-turn-helix domain-containing protein [Sphingopyxis sp.]|nr:helix-turn-helix domain-containing protein [Sphingopyxis sp.]
MARPSKPLITRNNAAEAALEVIDEHGLEALSLSLVAKKLGVSPPSLYHHFKDKAELLQEVVRGLLVRMPNTDPSIQTFEERIIARAVATRRNLLDHPNAAPLILRYFPRHMLLAAYNRAAAEEPYPCEVQMTVIDAVEKYTYGTALFEASARSRGIPPMPEVNEEKYPDLTRAIKSNIFSDEEMFIESLRMMLAGVRVRVATKTLGQPLDQPAPITA